MRVRWTAMSLSLRAGVSTGAQPGVAGSTDLLAELELLDPLSMSVVDLITVTGGARLAGSVDVTGAKNSALKLMAACLLAPGRSVITNVPRITDILIMAEV